jgi:predicted phosphohydrolase
MKVTAISDLHGNLIDIEPCDTLLICGDISPLEIQRDYIQMTKWFFNEFQKWIMNLPCDRVILTPGNHDFWFEKMITQSQTYLFNKLTILINGEVNIYSGVDDKYYKILGYVANIMEHKSETYPNGIPAGNIYLFDEIVEKKPKYVLSGHIHSGDHTLQEYAGTKYANVSILDESYSIKYKPLTFEL